jgi:hypothetical protein
MGESKKVLIEMIIKEIEQFNISALQEIWDKIIEINLDGR